MKKIRKYALKNGIILNGYRDMIPQEHKIILVQEKTIKDIVNEGYDISGYEVIDLKGQYIMPGLINMHVHLPASGRPRAKVADQKKLVKFITSNALTNKIGVRICANYAKLALYSGVTTIRTVGGIANYDTIIRDRVKNGTLIGPRVLASNMAVSVPGGHCAGTLAYEAKSCEEAVKYVEIIAKDKPDILKLMITGGVMDAEVVGEPGVLRMPADYVKATCDKAHELGMKVAAHVESSQGVQIALENGVDSIEHGAKPTEEIMKLFKEKHAFQVATFSASIPYALFDRTISHTTYEQHENGKVVFEGMIEMVKECLANGIPIGLGTDTGVPYVLHYNMWRELVYYVKYCGVTPTFALYSATLLNAKLANIDDITGSIEKGKMADMIVSKENPLQSPTALRNLSMVIAQGQVIQKPRVKKRKEVEAELDKFL